MTLSQDFKQNQGNVSDLRQRNEGSPQVVNSSVRVNNSSGVYYLKNPKELSSGASKLIRSKIDEQRFSTNFSMSSRKVLNQATTSPDYLQNSIIGKFGPYQNSQDQNQSMFQNHSFDQSDSKLQNQESRLFYTFKKKLKYTSKINNPPDIVSSMKIQSKFCNNTKEFIARSQTKAPSYSHLPLSQHKNRESKEFISVDLRSKVKVRDFNMINGSAHERDHIISKGQRRLMSSYNDQLTNCHFSPEYEQQIKQFPSIFRKSNGEFSAFASADKNHKVIASKSFSRKQMESLK